MSAADKWGSIVHIQILDISVKVLQADPRQDAPAKTVADHFLAGIDVVDPEAGADLVLVVFGHPGLDPAG